MLEILKEPRMTFRCRRPMPPREAGPETIASDHFLIFGGEVCELSFVNTRTLTNAPP
jgi:hypothetical protein